MHPHHSRTAATAAGPRVSTTASSRARCVKTLALGFVATAALALLTSSAKAQANAGAFRRLSVRETPVRSELLIKLSALAPDIGTNYLAAVPQDPAALGAEAEAALDELRVSLEGFEGGVVIEAFAPAAQATPEARQQAQARAQAAAARLTGGAKSPFRARDVVVRGYDGGAALRHPAATGPALTVTLLKRGELEIARNTLSGARRLRDGYMPPAPAPDIAARNEAPVVKSTVTERAPPPVVSPAPPYAAFGLVAVLQPSVTWDDVAYQGSVADENPYVGERRAVTAMAGEISGGLSSVAFGVRYRRDAARSGTSEFQEGVDGHDIEERQTSSAIGGWGLWQPWRPGGGQGFGPTGGLGLDVEWATVALAETFRDARLAAATTEVENQALFNLGALSLRGALGVEARAAGWVLLAEMRFQAPLFEFGRKTQGSDEGAAADMAEALDMRLAASAELAVGMGRLF